MVEYKSMTREQKKQILDHEFSELRRVGQVPFNGYRDPKYIAFDLSVLNRSRQDPTLNSRE